MNTLIKSAQDQRYTEFEPKVKEILKQKVSEKISEHGYFDRLDQAKGLSEGRLKDRLEKEKPKVDEKATQKIVQEFNSFVEKNFYKELNKMYKDFHSEMPESNVDLSSSGIFGSNDELSWGFEITKPQWVKGDYVITDVIMYCETDNPELNDLAWQAHNTLKMKNETIIFSGKDATYKSAKAFGTDVNKTKKILSKLFPKLLDNIETELINIIKNGGEY
jgi:hypothetical protein